MVISLIIMVIVVLSVQINTLRMIVIVQCVETIAFNVNQQLNANNV